MRPQPLIVSTYIIGVSAGINGAINVIWLAAAPIKALYESPIEPESPIETYRAGSLL